MSNRETALNYVIGLEQLRMQNGVGGSVRKTPTDLIEEAETFRQFLDVGNVKENRTVFLLTGRDDDDAMILGVYATREDANAAASVAEDVDTMITEWEVHDQLGIQSNESEG